MEKETMQPLHWDIKKFKNLTINELYNLLRLRVDVFVVEQTCPYPEMDGKDTHEETLHITALTENHTPAAYLRILAPGVSYPVFFIFFNILNRQIECYRSGDGTVTGTIPGTDLTWDYSFSWTNSNISPGWQTNAPQIASRVVNRIALARPDFSTDRFCSVIPIISASSLDFNLRFASITSRLTIMVMDYTVS